MNQPSKTTIALPRASKAVCSVASLASEVVPEHWEGSLVNDSEWEDVEVALVPISELFLDRDYQRTKLKSKVLQHIYEHFDVREFAPVVVSQRGRRYYIIDGQHRAVALAALGFSEALCLIVDASGKAGEARIFTSQVHRTNLKPFDLYRAGLIEGKPLYKAVDAWLTANQLMIKDSPQPGCIRFVNGFLDRWETSPEACKTVTLLCNDMEPDEPLDNNVHSGLWYLVYRGIDLLEHKQKLMQGGYVAIRREANKIMYTEDRSSRGGKNQRFWAAAILKVLNKRRRISRIEMPPAKIG